MGAYKNHEFLDLLQKEQERDRMELARREQDYLNSRKNTNTKPPQGTKQPKHDGTRN